MTAPNPAFPNDPLQTQAQFVKGVGPQRAELLKKLGIETVNDLLFFFPRAYDDLSDCRKIRDLTPGPQQTVAGEVVEMEGRSTSSGRNVLSVVISDGTGVIEGVWFNQPFMARKFRYGQRVIFSGKPQYYRDHWQISKPRVQFLDQDAPGPESDRVVIPVYPLTEGLFAEQMRKIARTVAEKYAPLVPDDLPPPLLQRQRLPVLGQALHDMHIPASLKDAKLARKRLVFEEFLILQLGLALRRRENQVKLKAPRLPISRTIDAHIRKLFPFQMTGDQDHVIAEICADMGSERPMQRLLQADVGAGKTAVAVYALLLAVAHKYQAALMAPTEVLARQHWRTLNQYLAKSRVRKRLLTGGLSDRERKTILGEIRMGQVDLVVGTQAIIQEGVEFTKLGLVVIDEQHRFGVAQRAHFRQMGEDPHYLVMTATPIPRTVALTVFGDLDVSVIREMPPGRHPVQTRFVREKDRAKLEKHIVEQLTTGRQLYVVYPLVSESESRDIKAAAQMFEQLQSGVFKDFKVGLLHGRLDDRVKDMAMTRFRDRELNILVSTSVIEVGVDVPNATLMVIEHADQFGLSQLHQLRGRVSRGPVAGECYILAEKPSDEAVSRMRLFVRTHDGFQLAEEDARLRGTGEFFGTKQHGVGELRIGNLIADADILSLARRDAFDMVNADPGLTKPEHAALRKTVLERYGKTLDLVEVG